MTPAIDTATSRRFGRLAALVVVTFVGLGSHVPEARAGGFLVYDQSAAAVGQASAVVAQAEEPAAVWYNPAALSFLPGYRVSLGGVVVTAATTFSPKGGGADVDTEPGVYFLPHLFATAEITPWLHAGVAALSAFGLGSDWPEDWIGREASISSSITTVTLNPALSFRLHDTISLAGGLQVVRGAVDLTNGLPEPVGGRARIGGAGWGFGGNVGVFVRPLPDVFHVGLTYRSRVAMTFDGRADFDPRPEFATSLPDQGGSADVTLPDILALGLMWRPTETVTLGLDTNLVLWNTYDETVLTLDEGEPIVQEHHYEPSWVVRAGVAWATPVPGLSVRGGLIWDQSPAPSDYLDPSLPDSDQIDVCVGLGYEIEWFAADVAYQLIAYLPAEATSGKVGPEGTYRTLGHFVALTLSMTFGR